MFDPESPRTSRSTAEHYWASWTWLVIPPLIYQWRNYVTCPFNEWSDQSGHDRIGLKHHADKKLRRTEVIAVLPGRRARLTSAALHYLIVECSLQLSTSRCTINAWCRLFATAVVLLHRTTFCLFEGIKATVTTNTMPPPKTAGFFGRHGNVLLYVPNLIGEVDWDHPYMAMSVPCIKPTSIQGTFLLDLFSWWLKNATSQAICGYLQPCMPSQWHSAILCVASCSTSRALYVMNWMDALHGCWIRHQHWELC